MQLLVLSGVAMYLLAKCDVAMQLMHTLLSCWERLHASHGSIQ